MHDYIHIPLEYTASASTSIAACRRSTDSTDTVVNEGNISENSFSSPSSYLSDNLATLVDEFVQHDSNLLVDNKTADLLGSFI